MIQHARRLFLALGLAATTAFSAATPAAAQIPDFQDLMAASQTKYAAIVVDAKSGEILYAKHADSPRYPASITKIMTLYLTFEQLAAGKMRLDDRVAFSPHAAAQAPSKLGVRSGDSVTVNEAISAMTTLSANDAAVAMGEKIAGTESRFAALMTLRAQELGMQNTHFVNANGLPDSRNLSSARDIAILSRAVMRDYPQYYHYFSLEAFNFRGREIGSHNHLLGPGVDGLKTGFTNASGFNIAISGVRDNRRLIVVVMGGPTRVSRDQNAEDLLLTGFNVQRRRAMGEKIVVAQNMFGPQELSGPIVRPPSEQGDGDQDQLKIELTGQPSARSAKIDVTPRKGRDVQAAGERAKVVKAKWAVQVGEFRSKSDAHAQIALVEKKFSGQFDGARGATDKAGRKYKAVFTGFTETDAKVACRALKAKRLACMVVQPA